jgi:hypothetical protein
VGGEKGAVYDLKASFRLSLLIALLWPLFSRGVEAGTRRNLQRVQAGVERRPANVAR